MSRPVPRQSFAGALQASALFLLSIPESCHPGLHRWAKLDERTHQRFHARRRWGFPAAVRTPATSKKTAPVVSAANRTFLRMTLKGSTGSFCRRRYSPPNPVPCHGSPLPCRNATAGGRPAGRASDKSTGACTPLPAAPRLSMSLPCRVTSGARAPLAAAPRRRAARRARSKPASGGPACLLHSWGRSSTLVAAVPAACAAKASRYRSSGNAARRSFSRPICGSRLTARSWV